MGIVVRTGESRTRRGLWGCVLASALLPSCGFLTAGAAASSGGGGGSKNAAPSFSTFDVRGLVLDAPKESPALIRLVVADAESDPASVELSMIVPSDPGTAHRLTGVASNPLTLATSSAGVLHDISWDFASEPALPASGSYVEGVKLIARARGGAIERTVGLGNDPPEVTALTPAAEVSGVASVRLEISDSSDDPVDVKVEYSVDGTNDWFIARPAGLLSGDATPEFAFEGITAPRGGATIVFFWDTNHPSQLVDLERPVRLRFSPRDEAATGADFEVGPFLVDNNDEPVIQLDEGSFLANSDGWRGVPIPYNAIDEEGDDLRVLFQWRPERESSFPDLETSDPAEILASLADPDWVRDKQICRPYATSASGRARPLDPLHVRLPELAGAESWILAAGIEGLPIDFMRSRSPGGLAPGWSQNELVRPVFAIPDDEGQRALVFDDDVGGGRVVEVDLLSGEILGTLLTGIPEAPTAFAREPSGSYLVAADAFGDWTLTRVDLEAGTVTPLLDASQVQGPAGPLRGLVSAGSKAVIATAEDAVWRIEWLDALAPRANAILTGLIGPRGLAGDPLDAGRIWVATGDHLLEVDMPTHTSHVVPGDFEAPEALAFDVRRNHLVALCRRPSGGLEVRVHALASAVESVVGTVESDATGIAAAEGVILAAHPASRDISAIGGVQERATIRSYDPATAIVELEAPLATSLSSEHPWRVVRSSSFERLVPSAPGGKHNVFVWDTRDVPARTSVVVRSIPFDDEQGIQATTTGPFSSRIPFEIAVNDLSIDAPGFGPVRALAAGDLDGDGDLDLVALSSQALRVFFQGAPGELVNQYRIGGSLVLDDPQDLALGDLDADGDLDIAIADRGLHSVAIYFSIGFGTYSSPLVLGNREETKQAQQVELADFDGDGDTDIVVGAAGAARFFFQTSPGGFTLDPTLYITSHPVHEIHAADVDTDGDVDLYLAHHWSVRLARQSAPGVFGLSQVQAGGYPSTSLRVLDLDVDGESDFFRIEGDLSNTFRLQYQSSGDVRETARFGTGDSKVVFVDVDEDGALDLVGMNDDRLQIYRKTGPTSYEQTPTQLSSPGLRLRLDFFEALQPLAVDFDGNGTTDIVAATEDAIRLFSLDKKQSWRRDPLRRDYPESLVQANLLYWDNFVLADLDADGDLDIATSGLAEVGVLYQSGAGRFPSDPVIVPVSEHGGVKLVAVDLDGDGDADLVRRTQEGIELLLQGEDGRFTLHQTIDSSLNGYGTLEVADLDGDHDLDLLDATGQGITAYDQTEPLVFVPEVVHVFPEERYPGGMDVRDLDGDGDVDFVLAELGYESLNVFLRDASGAYEEKLVAPATGWNHVQAEDLDGDGLLDLVVSSYDTIYVYAQLALGEFSAEPITASLPQSSGYLTSIVVRDLDDDGDMDIAGATITGLAVFLQVAPLQIAEPFILETPRNCHDVAAGDVDGDGDIDLATFSPSTLSVFFGGR